MAAHDHLLLSGHQLNGSAGAHVHALAAGRALVFVNARHAIHHGDGAKRAVTRVRDRSDLGYERQTLAAARYALQQSNIRPGDVLFVSSVSGRTASVVDLAYEAVQMGVKVIAFTSMEYAQQVDPVHPSGKKLYEFATLTLDNCAPAAEAMLEVEGIEARFAAASGIASDYIMWSLTSVAVEKLLEMGITPGILKSANFPCGNDYNKTIIEPHYDEFGW